MSDAAITYAKRQFYIMLAAFILSVMVNFGLLVWYGSAKNSAIDSLTERVAKLEESGSKSTDKLTTIESQVGKMTGQLEILISVLLAPESHISHPAIGARP